jgi:predicted transcriptional regulator
MFYISIAAAMPLSKPRSIKPRTDHSRSIREKLSPACVARMRDLVEGSTRSYKRIGEELGIATATVSRYAAENNWRRPPGAPLPARIGEQRERVTQKLWALTERHAEALEAQPIELAQRSLQPLARLTRTLTDMEKLAARQAAQSARDDTARQEAAWHEPPPARSIHELRDELEAHLNRIMQEEGYGWEVREWWFEGGGGI